MDTVEVTLPRPIPVDGQNLTKITLMREPTGADLGRHTVHDLLDGNQKAIAHVIPKITSPYVSPKMVKDMTASNLVALQNGIAAFLEGTDFDALVTRKTAETKTAAPETAKAGSSVPKA